jgi:hypothetical protein
MVVPYMVPAEPRFKFLCKKNLTVNSRQKDHISHCLENLKANGSENVWTTLMACGKRRQTLTNTK